MTHTELTLLALHRSPAIRLDSICTAYMNLTPKRAEVLASLNTLGIPTFRMRDSQKAPRLVLVSDLAAFMDERSAKAREQWETSQV